MRCEKPSRLSKNRFTCLHDFQSHESF
jgi:hypothetical protein